MSVLLLLSLLSLAFGRIEIGGLDDPHVPDSYIITYHTNTTHEEAAKHWEMIESRGIDVTHKWAHIDGFFNGFAATITDQDVLSALQEDPLVLAIEANGFAHAYQTHDCRHLQTGTPSWGLDRLSHATDVGNGIKGDFRYSSTHMGSGVNAYIIDTGIHVTHTDFGGRARWGASYADGGSQTDGNGHGTHCAGTVGGTRHGVAKSATLVAVKVLGADGSGTYANIVSGITWSCNDGRAGYAVLSMSLGGTGSNTAITNAVNSCVTKGIPVVVAAGNSNANACGFTPAGVPNAITVGATEIAGFAPSEFDNRASFSNYGTCLDIFAPGRDITSTWRTSNTATNTISGTSMACPHVAGLVAGILSANPSARPAGIVSELQASALKGVITNAGTGSPNYLAHNKCQS